MTLAGIDGEHRLVLAVDQHVVAFTSVLPVHRRVRRDRSVRRETQVGDDEQLLLDCRRHGIRARADDEKTSHATEHLLGGQLMRMRVIPVGPGAAHGQRELVGAARARSDRVHRIAILAGGTGRPCQCTVVSCDSGCPGGCGPCRPRRRRSAGPGTSALYVQNSVDVPGSIVLLARCADERRNEFVRRGTGVCESHQVGQGLTRRQRRHRVAGGGFDTGGLAGGGMVPVGGIATPPPPLLPPQPASTATEPAVPRTMKRLRSMDVSPTCVDQRANASMIAC